MIVSTSFDCTKLGLFPVVGSSSPLIFALSSCTWQFAWFTAARVLARFLRAAQEEKYSEQINILTDEISFIHVVLRRLGERVPISRKCRFSKHTVAIVNLFFVP